MLPVFISACTPTFKGDFMKHRINGLSLLVAMLAFSFFIQPCFAHERALDSSEIKGLTSILSSDPVNAPKHFIQKVQTGEIPVQIGKISLVNQGVYKDIGLNDSEINIFQLPEAMITSLTKGVLVLPSEYGEMTPNQQILACLIVKFTANFYNSLDSAEIEAIKAHGLGKVLRAKVDALDPKLVLSTKHKLGKTAMATMYDVTDYLSTPKYWADIQKLGIPPITPTNSEMAGKFITEIMQKYNMK